MALRSITNKPESSRLNAEIAETVFGWKNVQQRDGMLVGKKPDKLGRMRNAKVPNFVGDVTQAYMIEERMKQLGKESAYLRELEKLTKNSTLPAEWATPEQRGKAAMKVLSNEKQRKSGRKK
jgi:hypothetical protein